VSTTGPGRGDDEGDSPMAPPIPSFASLRAPRRSHPALDVLVPQQAELPYPAAPPSAVAVEPERPARPAEQTPAARPRPAEWPDLLRFGLRVAHSALRLPGVLVREPARRLRRLLGE
jgi:hypothetical protein